MLAQKENILVLTPWSYKDGLMHSYVLPYLKIIHRIKPCLTIYLFTEEGSFQNNDQAVKFVHQLKANQIWWMPQQYQKRGLKKYLYAAFNLFKTARFISRKKIRYIHAFCTPSGSYAYLLAKLTGAQLILDSYEPHSEYMRESGVWNPSGMAYKGLKLFEKLQAKKANHLIATTTGVLQFTENRFDIKLKKVYVKPACVDFGLFHFDVESRQSVRRQYAIENKIVCVFAGKFGGTYLEKEVFDFFKTAGDYWKDKFHVLLLTAHKEDEIKAYCTNSGFDYKKITRLTAKYEDVYKYLSAADFGLNPVRPSPSKRFCTPMKDGEYWACGLPVVITKDISDDSHIIADNKIGVVIPELNKGGYEYAVREMDELLEEGESLRSRIQEVGKRYRHFDIADKIYAGIYG